MNLPLKVLATIEARRLFKPGERVLLGVSGGADSVALLHVLAGLAGRLRIDLVAAHLDHRIRGRAAAADALFVKRLAARLGVPCEHARVDVPRLARGAGVSLEMAAREARYDFFARAARKTGAQVVVTAHTADDQAETILLNLARGSGVRGLGGIRYCAKLGPLRVARPLLDATRAEIVDYLEKTGAGWREDRTNRDPAFLRNRVRHQVLPFLESKLNPDIRGALLRAGEVLREEDELLARVAAGVLGRCRAGKASSLSVKTLCRYPAALRRRVIRQWLAAQGVAGDIVDFALVGRVDSLALRGRPGSAVEAGAGRAVRRRNGILSVEAARARKAAPFRAVVKVPGETLLSRAGLRVTVTSGSGVIRDGPRRAGRLPARASLDPRAVGRRRLVARSWRPGDRMRPLGMAGSKKIQDIFVDCKVPRERRGAVPIFECGGEIAWLPGYSVAEGWGLKNPAGRALHLLVEQA